ncbi:MAG: alpha-amylase family glycosyl hydrolase [Candidatus Nanopelagicales bacterium]
MYFAASANRFDEELRGRFSAREQDWRNGAVVYQVLVDRFAPSADLAAKAHLYPAPKRLRAWEELPEAGEYLPAERLYSHEIDFWGGDLASTRGRLDHLVELGVDVLYLNPIHLAYTNHAYDALDYAQVAPHFGSRDDVVALAEDVHGRGMRLVLDGVFNHMGRNSAIFRAAESDPASPYRAWFDFNPEFLSGVRCWWLAENLPELVLENPAVREYVYAGQDSIVRSYLRDGTDGWRLDVAMDIGMDILAELTAAAHETKPGSLVVGEIACYPKEWFPAVDAVLHFGLREIILGIANRTISAAHGQALIARLIGECDYEHLLKSWVYLENHDTPRLASAVTAAAARRLALVMQFTLPGSPNLYYGGEVGMAGGEDPQMRAPMRWDLVSADSADLAWHKKLIDLHQSHRALRVGDCRTLGTERLIGYQRFTDQVADAVLVLLNPSAETIRETVLLPDSKLMNSFVLHDLLAGPAGEVIIGKSLIDIELPAGGFAVLAPDVSATGGYNSYKRVR